jgi:hypothetical protein
MSFTDTAAAMRTAAQGIAANGADLEQHRGSSGHGFIRLILDGNGTKAEYKSAVNTLTHSFDGICPNAVYKTPVSARNSILARVGRLLADGTYTDVEQQFVMDAGYADESQAPHYKAAAKDEKNSAKKRAEQAASDANAALVESLRNEVRKLFEQLNPEDSLGCLRLAADMTEKAATAKAGNQVQEQQEYGRIANGLRAFKTARATQAAQTA